MVARAPLLTILVISALCLKSNGDFPQIHRALPGANGKPGYRVTSSQGAKVGSDDDNTIQNQHGMGTDKQTHADQVQTSMDFESQWSQAAFYSIISCTLVGLSGIFPLIIIPLEAGPTLQHGAGSAMLKLLLSFAVGSLLGDVFLHLLPEAWATVHLAADPHWAHTVIGLWVICGMLSFMTIEKVFSEFEEEEEDEAKEMNSEVMRETADAGKTSQLLTSDSQNNIRYRVNGVSKGKSSLNGCVANGKEHLNGNATHDDGLHKALQKNGHDNSTSETHHDEQYNKKNNNIHITGYLNLLANCIDNFTHGLAVGGSYLISPKVGLCTTIAILLHEIPHEIGDFAILLRSGFDRWKAAKAQVLTASGGMLGAITALMSESAEEAGDRTAAILPFTAGGFIYIALVTVVPELLKEKCLKESVKQMACVILGVLSMMLVTVIFDG